MSSLSELQNLYNETLVREIIEKTRVGSLRWSLLDDNLYQVTEVQDVSPSPDITWDLFISKTAYGNVTSNYTLEVKKDTVSYVTVTEGPLPYTNRNSAVKELYENVEILVLEIDDKFKEAINFVQNLSL